MLRETFVNVVIPSEARNLALALSFGIHSEAERDSSLRSELQRIFKAAQDLLFFAPHEEVQDQ